MISMAPAQDRTAEIVETRSSTLATEHGCLTLGSFLPKAVSGKRSAVLSLSGRSERASNLPTWLHQNPCPGLLPVLLYRRWSSSLPRLGFLREIAWLLPVPKESRSKYWLSFKFFSLSMAVPTRENTLSMTNALEKDAEPSGTPRMQISEVGTKATSDKGHG